MPSPHACHHSMSSLHAITACHHEIMHITIYMPSPHTCNLLMYVICTCHHHMHAITLRMPSPHACHHNIQLPHVITTYMPLSHVITTCYHYMLACYYQHDVTTYYHDTHAITTHMQSPYHYMPSQHAIPIYIPLPHTCYYHIHMTSPQV